MWELLARGATVIEIQNQAQELKTDENASSGLGGQC